LNGEVGSEFNKTVLARSSKSFPDDVVIGYNNLTGNKMDFYLNVDAGGSTCRVVELRFTSTADPNVRYPDYLARRLDADEEALIGSYLAVNAVFPQGVEVVAVEESGEPVSFDRYAIDGTRTFVRTWVEVPVGETRDIAYTFAASQSYCQERIRVSPMRHDVGE